MGVVVCPRCRAPNDAPPNATGQHRCMICDHVWAGNAPGETALTSSQQSPRARMAAMNPRISQEYLPDDPANEAARALTGRRASDGPAIKGPGKPDGRPGSDLKPHSDRSHGGVIPPLKVLPSPPLGSPVQPAAAQPPATAQPPRVTPNTPTVEVDMDLFDRLENEAQVKRSRQNTLPELTFEAANQPAGEGRTMACPVCGHGFVASDPTKTLTCPQCHTSFNHSSGRLSTPESPQPGADPLIGRNLRGCVIDRKLGEGGMGSVYHASQLSLERSVAIKVLPPDLARNRNFIQRFEREAKSLAKINHPNILHIYDFGEDQSLSLYFMIIEFVDGKDLGDLLNRRATLPQLEVLDLLRQAALGLEMAAEKGVIHRDIKPDNLMIADTGICKVSDFGLAKGYGEENEVTSVGVRVGTPAFMSPEQCDGIEVDFRSDVYNLGCTAYLALTGHLPFDGETPFSIMLKHKSDPIPSMRDISPSIDPRVDRLIQRMLQKKPVDRCDHWRNIIDEIEQIQIELSGTNSILRKTRGQMQALSVGKEGAIRPVEQPPMAQLPTKSPPAEIRESQPGQLPEWLRPVDMPPEGTVPTVTPAPHPLGDDRRRPSSSGRMSTAPAAAGEARADDRDLLIGGDRAGRSSRRLSTDLEAARERGLRAEAEALATSAERLAAVGRFEDAAKDWRKAAELSPDVDRAAVLRKKAAEARSRGGAGRLAKRFMWLLVFAGLVVLLAWTLTPLAHNFLAERSLLALADVRDEQVRIDRLRVFANEQRQPYGWYEKIFHGTYTVKAADEAKLQADELERGMRATHAGAHSDSTALRDLEEAYADPRVPWQPVLERAAAMSATGSARERDRAREIQGIVQSQLSKMAPELQWIEAMRKEGRFREALERAAQFRTSFPRAGVIAAALPLPARVDVVTEDGQQIAADVRVDGTPLSGTDRSFCRRGNAESVVEVSATGFASVRQTIAADLDPSERVVHVVLRVAPVWKRTVGTGRVTWAFLHQATDGVYVQRPDGVFLLRASDGDAIAAFTPPVAADVALTPLWIEDRGRLLISCDDGQVRNLDARTLAADHVLLRAPAGVQAWMEAPLTYRPAKIVRYLVEETRESRDTKASRFVVAMDGAQELWKYQGISGRGQQPLLIHHLDRVVVIDDTSAHFLEEDGSSVQILDLLEARLGPPLLVGRAGAKPDERAILMPTAAGVQWVRFGPRTAPMQTITDPILDAAGAALAAADGDTVVLARADHGLDLVVFRDNIAPTGKPVQPGFERVWHADGDRPFGAAPALGPNIVVASDDQGRLTVWARDTGAVLGHIAHGTPPASQPLVRDGAIIMVDASGAVVAYAVPGGR